MRFSKFAEYLEKLEKTSKRLEMFDILSQMFKEADKSEVDEIVYFCEENLKPAFYGIEMGMADRMVVKAIAKVSGRSEKEVDSEYKKSGDLGLVVEKLVGKQSTLFKAKKLGIEEVYNQLLKIAETGGSGSVDKKVAMLSGLLSICSGLESRYVVRFVLGRLRLGIGDPTLMDSMSKALTGDRMKLRPEIERAYNLCSDLGKVASVLFNKGERGLKEFKVVVGNPIRMALAERFPSGEEIIKKIGKCAVETKYDGLRCIAGFTPIYVKERGLLPVRDIKVGDLVLTHKGKFRKVIAKNKRIIDKNERVFEFQTYLGNEFRITEGHRILCNLNDKIRWIPVEDVPEKSEVIFPLPEFPIKELPFNLILQTISNYKKEFKLNENFYRFIGFWIGDGYSNEYNATNRIGILFNAKTEKELCEEYRTLIKKEFNISNFGQSVHNGAIQLYWEDKPLLQWLSHNFRQKWRDGWKGKTLPEWFFGINKEQFSAFLKGWFEADGCEDDIGRKSITTKEASLAVMAQLTALRFGIIMGIKKFRVNNGTYYKLIITKNERKARIKNGNVFVKILRKKELLRTGGNREIDPRQSVYNLQVEGDESYCTTMCALHNCQIHKKGDKVEIFSRNLERMTPMFPDIAKGILKQLKLKDAILEGEAVAYNEETGEFSSFQVTITRKRKYKIEETVKDFPLVLFAFDLLYDGKDLTQKSYHERRMLLEKSIKKDFTIRPADRIVTENPKELEKFFEENIERGTEGIMAKRLDSEYQAGARNFNWIKLKRSYKGELQDTIDVVIVGYLKGRGMRARLGIGALLGAVYDEKSDSFKTVAKIGSGLSEEKWVEIRKLLDKSKIEKKPARVDSLLSVDQWTLPKYVFTVRADEITKSPIHTAARENEVGLALRFPRIQGWIRDKKAEDATSVKELKEMFKMQKKVKAISLGK